MIPMFHLCGVWMNASSTFVGRDRDLGEIVEEVVEKDLGRQHRQEREEQERARHAEHVAEVRARPHEQVLHHVARGAAALENPAVKHSEATLAQNHVGCLARHIGRAHDRDPDVGGMKRRSIVDPVAHEPHNVATTLQREDHPVLLRR